MANMSDNYSNKKMKSYWLGNFRLHIYGSTVDSTSTLYLASLIALVLIPLIPQTVAQTYVKYNDPNGKFSITYPYGWSVRNVVTGPVVNLTLFHPPNFANLSVVMVGYTDLRNTPKYKSVGNIAVNTTELRTLLNTYINSSFGMNRTTVIQPADCNIYTIAGENACTVTLQSTATAGTSLGIKVQTMLMLSYINGTVYYLQAGAPQPNFGQIFPIFFKMLSSFKPSM